MKDIACTLLIVGQWRLQDRFQSEGGALASINNAQALEVNGLAGGKRCFERR